MGKILDRITSLKKKKSMEEYEENKEEFEKVMGKPTIEISVELPEGCEDKKKEFLDLEEKEAFLKDVTKLVKRHLKRTSQQHKK